MTDQLRFPKPEPRARTKRRAKRAEARVSVAVRAACVLRDGACRFRRLLGACDGPSEWAHLDGYRRFKTVGMAPDLRHTTRGSAMFCRRHHYAYDAHAFDVVFTTDRGADGPLSVVTTDGVILKETT